MRIPGILELNSRIKYGLTSKNVPIYLFRPLDTKLGLCIVGSSHRDISTNVLALADVSEFNKKELTRGNLVRIIGKCGDYAAEKEANLCRYSTVNWKGFDLSKIKVPEMEPPTIDGYTFNIDPIGCEDIDDVFTVGENGYYYITIADVGAWFDKNPDNEFISKAAELGQTYYTNGSVVAPLLPFQHECSLLPNQKRLGVSLKFKWDKKEISEISFMRTTIVNDETFNYESIYNSPLAYIVKDISSYLAGRDLVDSHEWVEHLMIFYNVEAAKVLVQKNNGLLRVHEKTSKEKLESYKSILGLDAKHLAFKSAEYSWTYEEGEKSHWGIGKDYYCHATSPIRRYADILNQLIITDRWNQIWYIESYKLNESFENSKKYSRDEFFLDKLLTHKENRCVNAIILNDHRVWVPDWKRLVTYKNEKQPGTVGTLSYSLDMNQPTWKRRMVFRFEDTNYLE